MQTALKTRLLGAAVLVALAVIVVPLFFSGEPSGGGSQSISLDIPQPPDEELQTRTLSVAPPADTATTAKSATPAASNAGLATVNIPSRVPPEVNPVAGGETQAADDTATAAASTPPAAEETQTTTPPTVAADKPKAEEKPPTATPGKAANGRYQVSLGAYAKKSNAQRLVAKVAKLGYQARVSATRIGGKPAARVDVGPFDSRASAEAARLKLHAALPRAPAKLVSTPSDQQDDAPTKALPDNRAGGWAVQVVAYDKRKDADKLRDRLRKAGFDSYVDDVVSGGNTLWRVRVGPLTQRDDAVSALKRIKSKFSRLGGVVVTVP